MADGYSWNHMREETTYRLPGPDHLGWWAGAAMVASILLHVAVFFALERMKIALNYTSGQEMVTSAVKVRRVEVNPMDDARSAPVEEVAKPQDSGTLLEEVDLLNALPKDQEIDIKPDTLEPAYALKVQQPAAEGVPNVATVDTSAGMDFEADLPEFGREPETLKPSEVGRVTVDPGAVRTEDKDLGKLTENLLKFGAGGKAEHGKLDGVVSLEEMLELPSNLLLAKKTMLPSDLLFEFNSSQLRESAKVGLMKLALLMDRNPGLFCWIEGHTDLVGGDEFNLKLSTRRAEEVKSYLVQSMRMDAKKIFTHGFGRNQPIVTTGNTKQQEINRRVEIRMRKEPPSELDRNAEPRKATVVQEPSSSPAVQPAEGKNAENSVAEPPKAVVVKPRRAMPVDAVIVDPAPPQAVPVAEPAPRAAPVIEPGVTVPSRPVGPPAPRAMPVQE